MRSFLFLALFASVTACSAGPTKVVTDPGVVTSPSPTPSRPCVSDFIRADELADVLADVRQLPTDAALFLQASALTQAIHARIGLARTERLLESELGVAWQLQLIQARFAANPADLCQPL